MDQELTEMKRKYKETKVELDQLKKSQMELTTSSYNAAFKDGRNMLSPKRILLPRGVMSPPVDKRRKRPADIVSAFVFPCLIFIFLQFSVKRHDGDIVSTLRYGSQLSSGATIGS